MARPIAKDHDDKRLAILKAAARLFAEEGYGRASMAQVAERCGISKANIYHYYPGKDALLFDILDTHLSGLRDRICGLRFSRTEPDIQLREIITELLRAYQGADAEHAVQLNALTALPLEKQNVLKGYQRDLVKFVQERLRRIAPPHVSQDKTRLRQLTMSVFAMVNWHYQWDRSADTASRDAYAAMISDLVVGGIGQLGQAT